MRVSPGHFTPHPADAEALFRDTVSRMEIEISSYCNRRCGFCPNAFLDRIGDRRFMADDLFHGILRQLDAMAWRGFISLHRYNEPLADRDYLLRRLGECRDLAPQATVQLFTNGDYLDRDYLDAIRDAGCRDIICTVYLKEGAPYDDDVARATIADRLRRLDLAHEWQSSQPGQHFVRVTHRDMNFTMRSIDYKMSLTADRQLMSSRGGSMGVNAGFVRTDPCLKPFQEMQIEVDGTLMPCCECRSDFAAHRPYVMGKLRPGDSIVAAWTDETYVAWRKSLFSYEKKQKPCDNCVAPSLADTPETRGFVAAYRDNLGLDVARTEPVPA